MFEGTFKVHSVRWSCLNENELEFYRLSTIPPVSKYFLGRLQYKEVFPNEDMIDDPTSTVDGTFQSREK